MTAPDRPRRPVLERHQGLWTAILTLVGLALAVWWISRREREEQHFVRFATFNASLFRDSADALVRDLEGGGDAQARKVAEIVQRVRPDVLLLNEFDWDRSEAAAKSFVEEYLAVAHAEGVEPIEYAHRYTGIFNTGQPSGLDLDNDGSTDGPGDALGFGRHPGQYGMLLLSRFPILRDRARTFRELLWRDMPGNRIPTDYYDDDELARLPLSSKSHWDVPVLLTDGGMIVHVLASHPTPPVFDGPEDRNGRRNADEIRLLADLVGADPAVPDPVAYLRDDAGVAGGLPAGASFVIVGDLNADPVDGDGLSGAIDQLLSHPRVGAGPAPKSAGAADAARAQWGANSLHQGDHATDTGDFPDDRQSKGPGNLRLDYVLPSVDLTVLRSGVFWPAPRQPGHDLLDCSDHRMVWLDIRVDS